MLPVRRAAVSLDGTWEFVPDPERRLTTESLPTGVPITVPGPWEAQVREPQGIVQGWYRRRFRVPETSRPGRLVLRFDAALRRARVWLDGRLVGEQDDGFLPFELEAGEARPGVEHDLVVAVDNPFNALTEFPAFDREAWRRIADRIGGTPLEELPAGKQTWYTSTSGLLGSVTACVVPEVRLAGLTVHPEPDADRVLVRWQLAGGSDAGSSTIDLSVAAPGGDVVADCSIDSAVGEASLEVGPVERWGLWQPALYTLTARLRHGETADEATVRFGFRTVAVGDGFVRLNGRPVYVRGALDQDLWPEGRSNPPSRAALLAQLGAAREMGLNLLRCHIKIPDPRYLDVADEAGMLLWCELPSWDRFSLEAGERARRLLAGMVDALGHHPSIVAWTIVNEDWGTDLRHSGRDRRWLRGTADWLMERDPSRLVVDNSACETAHGPNFHLRTHIADFHADRSAPDGLSRWEALVRDFARRPAWLWSPYGDASPTGEEPLILSEFGGWGLPRPSAVRRPDGGEPWWWSTGLAFCRPAGIEGRFREQRLDRIWPDLEALAEATQWQQFEGLASQVRELRRHGSIGGYVITELVDAFWEANGLLDVGRGRKIFHGRLTEFNAEDVLVVDMPRTDLWGGERLECQVVLASHPDTGRPAVAGPARLDWQILLADGRRAAGTHNLESWREGEVGSPVATTITVPRPDGIVEGELVATATGANGRRATHRERIVTVPPIEHRSAGARRVAVVDPMTLWSLESRLRMLGHTIVSAREADLVVAAQLDSRLIEAANAGGRLLVLARSEDAIPSDAGLAVPAAVVARRPGDDGETIDRPWDGDWTSVFAWALPGAAPGLPEGGLLHRAHAEVFPDHVITGVHPGDTAADVRIGMFAGWLHSPAAILTRFRQGAGEVTLTTLRLSPEDGPLATAFLELIIRSA